MYRPDHKMMLLYFVMSLSIIVAYDCSPKTTKNASL